MLNLTCNKKSCRQRTVPVSELVSRYPWSTWPRWILDNLHQERTRMFDKLFHHTVKPITFHWPVIFLPCFALGECWGCFNNLVDPCQFLDVRTLSLGTCCRYRKHAQLCMCTFSSWTYCSIWTHESVVGTAVVTYIRCSSFVLYVCTYSIR